MKNAYLQIALLLFIPSCLPSTNAQKKKDSKALPTVTTKLPVATQWTLDAAGPTQRAGVTAVMLLICPQTQMKGTGFLIENGLVVTNAHVIAGCSAEQMVAQTTLGTIVKFTRAVTDTNVDLALLKPSEAMSGGLQLSDSDALTVGTAVFTWGFPLQFNGPAPLLSAGYLSGFLEDGAGPAKVKHIVIDGAINPGNSGGPLFMAGNGKVIGIVVAKFLPYSTSVQKIINAMALNKTGVIYTSTEPNGTSQSFTEGQLVADVLQEYYNGTQVMIGEAIYVSELKDLIATRAKELDNPPGVSTTVH
jgi:S1-C subfamily serine protease